MATCHNSCLTCLGNAFYQCLSCPPNSLFSNNMCLQEPIYGLQLAVTLSLLIFILPQLFHYRRLLVLSKIYNYVQFVSYYKYFLFFEPSRYCYLSILGRGWGDWTEGWTLVGLGSGVGLWTSQETIINKSIRIASMVGGVAVLSLLIGGFKLITAENNFKLSMYIKKNWLNTLMLGVFVTAQDMAFVVAEKLYFQSSSFLNASSPYLIIETILGVVFVLILLAAFYALLFVVNDVVVNPPAKQTCFYHANLFIFAYEFNKLPTLSDLENDSAPKRHSSKLKRHQKFNYSNLRILDLVFKIIYPFVIIGSFSGDATGVPMSVLGLFLFSQIVFWMVFPFEPKEEYLQITILSLTQIITVLLLLTYGSGLLGDIVIYALCIGLVGLGLLSLLLEVFLKVHQLVPVDLYETGSEIYINIYNNDNSKDLDDEKEKLRRKMVQLEEENRKRIMEMDEEEKRRELKRQQMQKELEEQIRKLKEQQEQQANEKKRKQLEWEEARLREQRAKNMTEQQLIIEAQKKDIQEKVASRLALDFEGLQEYTWERSKFKYSKSIEE